MGRRLFILFTAMAISCIAMVALMATSSTLVRLLPSDWPELTRALVIAVAYQVGLVVAGAALYRRWPDGAIGISIYAAVMGPLLVVPGEILPSALGMITGLAGLVVWSLASYRIGGVAWRRSSSVQE